MATKISSIAFIGLGVMGQGMVRNLLKAGYTVNVYTRTKEKAQSLLAEGCKWMDTPARAAEASDCVITMVGYPGDVEEVYFGSEGILSAGNSGLMVADMTTSTPTLAKRIYEKSKVMGVRFLDAPVSGGDVGARNGTLSIMVGGDKDAFDDMMPVFSVLGSNIKYQGNAGSGQHTKMCNQIAIATNMVGVTEAVVYAKKAGLDPQLVLESISAGAAGSWSLSNLVPRMLKEDYSPGFFIKHFVKDMGIAIKEADHMGLELPGLTLAKKMYEALAESGEENSGTQALIKYWTE